MLSFLYAWLTLNQGTPPSGRAIVAAMHDRYVGKWYRTLTFVQRNTATAPDGVTEHSTWLEYAAIPGRLRIEFQPRDSGGGVLFVRDSQDLATVHEDTWEGRSVYIVGAASGDRHRRQFWVDKERLVFVRLLEPAQRDTTRTSDIRFNDYRPAGDAWLSAEVAFLVDGKQRWLEQYTEIQTGTALPDSLFDPRRWAPRKD
ncbi:MAG: hypothetical protein DMD61_11495 [Gemmatimonadetes bacterium]|nr:MAG: hypothetical protein DMD61_11495 [Gemmatimonadota bacterium]